MKRIASFLLALGLLISMLPAEVLAAEFSVGSGEELASSWEAANNNADTSNTFNMTNDIDIGGQMLEANAGKIYVVNGSGNTISNVSITAGDGSYSGTVLINADVEGTTQSALYVAGDTDVQVTGDVSGENFAVVIANDNAHINIQGDVSTQNQGIVANGDSFVYVNGDITLEDIGPNNQAIVANDSSVWVNGNVDSGELGVMAVNGTVQIAGNLTDAGGSGLNEGSSLGVSGNYISDMDTPIYNDGTTDYYSNIGIDSDSSLTIGGNLQVHDIALGNDSSLQVGGTVTVEYGSIGFAQDTGDDSTLQAENFYGDLSVSGNTGVTITGNHTGNLQVHDSGSVTINGNATGDSTIVDGKDGASITVKGDLTNSELTCVSGGSLHVDGKLTNTGTDIDGGIVLTDNANLYVWEDTTAVHMVVAGSSTADLGIMHVNNMQVGTPGDRTDKSKLTCSTTASNTGNLGAYGSSSTIIRGSVIGKVTARDNARVEIWGNANSIDVESPAIVTYNTANYYGQSTTVTGADADPLLTMCQAYTQGSQLSKQVSSLQTILTQASKSLTEEMNLGSATVTALFHHEEINLSKIGIPELEAVGQFNSINPASLDQLLAAENIDPYAVSLYKDSLHKAFLSLDNKNIDPDAFDQGEAKVAMDICKGFFGTAKDVAEVLSSEQIQFLKAIFGDNVVSFGEAKEYLFEFNYYKKDSKLVDAAARRLADMLNFCKNINGDLDADKITDTAQGLKPGLEIAGKAFTAIDLLMTGAEFLDFWIRDYESQIGVLDRMIQEQEMTPEMLVAALELRNDYNHKFMSGILDRVKDVGLKHTADFFKNANPLYAMVEGTVNLAGLVTGATAKTEKLMKGAALTGIVPQLMNNFENSIQTVKNGDTSEDALRQVQANYTLLTSALKTMCELAGDVTKNDDHEAIFESYVDQLESLSIGTDYTTQRMYFE